jgi:hypothetical protein
MIEVLPQSTEKAIGFKFSGKFVAEDYDVIFHKLDEAIATSGKINMLVLLEDFKWRGGLEGAKADFEMGTHQYRQVEKAAFIGEKKWQEWMIKIIDPFTRRTDERFFGLDQLDEAWDWVLEE